MPSAGPQHRSKRQYQPPITSFFANGASPAREASPSTAPILPANVQSNLLNVGMRVRKAVPGGYKNKVADEPVLQQPKPAPTRDEAPIQTTHRASELQPFCGLHKIGGLASQQADDTFPTFLSSQESTTSAISTDSMPASQRGLRPFYETAPSNPQKRRFEEDEDDAGGFEEAVLYHANVGSSRRSAELDFGEADFLRSSEDEIMDTA